MNVEDFVMERDPRCLSDLDIDRLLAGELDGTPAVVHVEGCARCAARKAALEADAARFDEEIFVQGLAARAARQARTARKQLPWRGLLGAVAAAVLVVAVLPRGAPSGIRTKGGGALELIAKRDDGSVERVLPGDALAPGDAIRFDVQAPPDAWVAIVGVDSAQVVTPYVAGAVLPKGREVLPGSIVLDETLGAERIVAVFCEKPVPTDRLVEAGKRALVAAGGDPAAVVELGVADCAQSSVLIRKVEKP